MSIVNPPDIQSHAHSDDFTEVSFSPDLARLGLPLTGVFTRAFSTQVPKSLTRQREHV